MIGISRVTKDFGVEAHTLREWEKRGWLEDVLKDPEQNNQRVYSPDQVERIQFIQGVIEEQRSKGIKRTDLKEVEKKLIDQFGGMVEKIETGLSVHPNSIEQFGEFLQLQNRKILELESLLLEQQNRLPADNLDELKTIQKALEDAGKREEENRQTISDMNQKLQTAVDFIQRMEEKESEKKSIWKRLFG